MTLFRASRRTLAVLALAAFATHAALAEDKPMQNDVLNLEATVSSEVAPDLAVVTLAATREGNDAGAITSEVNQILARALAEAKATPGVQAASGGYSTYPRFDNKGQRTGWQVRAELILKSRDFGTLGRLAGKLSSSLQIVGSGFEVSPELRSAEEEKLIEQAIAAFQHKARIAVKTLGMVNYSLRQITLGSAQQHGGGPRPMMMMRAKGAAEDAAAMPIEGGRVPLQLTVAGSVQMRR